MRFLYHTPSPYAISAGRPILEGYKNAILDLGHEFKIYTAGDNLKRILQVFRPHIFMTGLSSYSLKQLDLDLVGKQRKRGMKVFVHLPFWNPPMSKFRINEVHGVSTDTRLVNVITSNSLGDVYYNMSEQGDRRMEGFEKKTGYKYHTILLAADKILAEKKIPDTLFKFKADISFIGTYLPEKRKFMKQHVFPLSEKYDLRLFCQDLTVPDRMLNFMLKVGQYFNIPYLRSFKKNNVTFEQERIILRNSTICLNVHEDYQKKFGDFNDRTFKIPAYGGFEITDNVPAIGRYLVDGKEVVMAKNKKDWFEKIEYYLKNPDKRLPIIAAGRKKVLQFHTYHNRVDQIIELYKSL